MPGSLKWTVTCDIAGLSPKAEIYSVQGGLVRSEPVPCDPPLNCPFPMNNVQFSRYKAAIVVGSNRYYYVQGQPLVTLPNQESTASVIELSQQNPSEDVTISAQSIPA